IIRTPPAPTLFPCPALFRSINNLPGATFAVSGNADFSQSASAAHAFNNGGTFIKTGAGTTTDFNGVAFNNSGAVNLVTGTLGFSSGGSTSTHIARRTRAALN